MDAAENGVNAVAFASILEQFTRAVAYSGSHFLARFAYILSDLLTGFSHFPACLRGTFAELPDGIFSCICSAATKCHGDHRGEQKKPDSLHVDPPFRHRVRARNVPQALNQVDRIALLR